jgi:hypothetical protein
MTRVLLVGYDPEAVDFSNPALPPGMSIEKIRAGVALAIKQMTDRGWEGDVCYIRPDGTAGQMVERHLASANFLATGDYIRRLSDEPDRRDLLRPFPAQPMRRWTISTSRTC